MLKNLDEHSYAGKLTGEIYSSQGPDKNMSSVGLYFKRIITPKDKSECFRSYEDFKKLYYSFQCEVCNFISVNKVSMQWHVYAHLLNRPLVSFHNEKPFKCVTCNENFATGFKLKKHVREHRFEKDQQKRHFCSKCQVVFTSLEIAQKHWQIYHRPKSYRCNLCNRRFYSLERMSWHITLHVVEKPFKCTKCAKAFRCGEEWILHQKLHYQDSTFKCNTRKKTVVSYRDFNQHLQGHMEWDKACPVCSEKFSDRKSLRVHMITHSGKNLVCCDICGKNYIYQESLTKHKKLHTMAECQFHCDICQKDFNSGTVFKQHIELFHSAENKLLTHSDAYLAHGLEGSKGVPVPTCLLFKLPTSSESSCTALTALPEHSLNGGMESESSPVSTSPPSNLPLRPEPRTMETESLPVPTSLLFNLPTSSELKYPAFTALRALLEHSTIERESLSVLNSPPSNLPSGPEHSTMESESLPVPTSLLFNRPTSSELKYPAFTALRALQEHSTIERESLSVPNSLMLPSVLEPTKMGNETLTVLMSEPFNLPSPSKLS